MRYIIFPTLLLLLSACTPLNKFIEEKTDSYIIHRNFNISVSLKTTLNTSINKRGDQFTTLLKKPISHNGKTVLPEKTEINGLIKRVTKYEKFGDRAGFALLFDQIVLPNGLKLPISASLDTDKGSDVIKSDEKLINNAKIVGQTTIVGAMVGKSALGKLGTQKGIILGAAAGTGAVIIGNMKELILNPDIELVLKLDESLVIPK